MKLMEKENLLQQLGLSEKESALYLTALDSGVVSITQLAKKSGLKRPTCYLVIEELVKKHLLTKTPKGKRICYKAENPLILSQQIAKTQETLNMLLPSLLSSFQKHSHQPKIRFYEGKQQISKMSEEIYHAKEIWAMFSPKNFLNVFSKQENKHFFNILIRHGGVIYDMFEDTPQAREFAQAKHRTGISHVKFLPSDFKIATDFMVYEDKLAIVSFENLIGLIIEDKAIAQTQRQMLKFIWEKL